MGRPLPVLPPHPAVHLGELEALAGYLRSRGIDYSRQPYGVTIEVDIGEIANFIIDVHWLIDQVRFVAVTPLTVAATRLSEVALAVERVNAEIGFPVWRVLPTLAATYTATLDHTGALSSRVVEYAMALLRDALVRDQPVLRALTGVSHP
jgi:hypothetical protein